ncbi:hypothetical protein CBS101457_003616 [Exobasidium rhododendri]|nr:hypothetical protein CBS101457_003616 [Exobasidium rhododendri]
MDSAIDPSIDIAGRSNEAEQSAGAEADTTETKDVTLEEEVKQLVGSVSSWWTGFSKRSQEQINAARKEIESQGGIVSIAKKEAQRFEAQLNEAQKSAREKARTADSQPEKGKSLTEGSEEDSDTGKGKQKEVILEEDDGLAVDALEEKAERDKVEAHSAPMVMGTGEAIFDVDGNNIDSNVSIDHTIQVAKQNAQTALHNVQSFWDRLQADPRLNSIQASLAKTLETVSQSKDDTLSGEGGKTSKPIASFADLSKQFQASFPHLNLKESQAMAKKYFEASENVAKDWGKEMTNLMGDLVKIVPPEESSGGATKEKVSVAKPQVPAAIVRPPVGKDVAAITTATTEDEEFDWDGDMDSNGLQTNSGPPTTSWEGSIIGSESDLATSPVKVAKKLSPKKVTAKSKEMEEGEEDVESDWE